jgi:hypothetical protein
MTERSSPGSAPILPVVAIVHLTNHQVQCDEDGVMVMVSRQALAEVLVYIQMVRSVIPDVAQGAHATDTVEECARIAESHVGAASDRLLAGHYYDEACRDIAKAIRDAMASNAAPQAATGTGDLVNRLLAAPVTLKTGREAAAVIAELEAENKRLRAEPQEVIPTDEDHPDCATARERELYDALMLLAGACMNHAYKSYKTWMQGGIKVDPVVTKALRLYEHSLSRPQRGDK